MMKKTLMILGFGLVVVTTPFNPVFASNHVPSAHEDVVLKIDGMVCDFCARSVLKVFENHAAVSHIDVNLDASTITIHEKAGEIISDKEIKDGIFYAGYELQDIKRVAGTD